MTASFETSVYMALFRQQVNVTKGCWNFKEIRIVGGNIDPCIYVKMSEKGIVYAALYIDDNFMVGNIEAMDEVIAALKENELVLKIVEEL